MREVYRTTNPSEIAILRSVFESAGIKAFVFDEYALGNSLQYGMSPGCRFMVMDEEYDHACALLKECKLGPSP